MNPNGLHQMMNQSNYDTGNQRDEVISNSNQDLSGYGLDTTSLYGYQGSQGGISGQGAGMSPLVFVFG